MKKFLISYDAIFLHHKSRIIIWITQPFSKKNRRERCYLTYFQSKMKENNEEQADLKSANSVSNKKLFIETYGCQMNVADSEVVASIMQMDG